jgi:hypothetical protein
MFLKQTSQLARRIQTLQPTEIRKHYIRFARFLKLVANSSLILGEVRRGIKTPSNSPFIRGRIKKIASKSCALKSKLD